MDTRKRHERYIFIGAILFILTFSNIAVSEFEYGQFWSKNDATVVLTNSSDNVNVGENETTEYKLKINGTSFFNDTVTIDKHVVIDESLNFTRSSNQIQLWFGAGGVTYLDIPQTAIGSNTITFPLGTYNVVTTATTQTISSAKAFTNPTIVFAEYLGHYLDFGTDIQFSSDRIDFHADTDVMLSLFESGFTPNQAVFNEGSDSFEFRIETDEDPFALNIGSDKGIECGVNVICYENLTSNGGFYPPDITTGADLTQYEGKGSLIINTSTNLIGTYDGSSWYWR